MLQILAQVGDGGAVEVPHNGGLYRAMGERQTEVRPDTGIRIVHHEATTKARPVRFNEVHGRLSLPAEARAEVGRARVERVRKSVFFDGRDGALVAVPRQDNTEVSNAKLPRDAPVHADEADVRELIEHGLSDGLLIGLGLGLKFDQQDVPLNFMRGRKEGPICSNIAASRRSRQCCGPRSSDERSTVACPSYHEEPVSGAASVSGTNRWSPSAWMPTPAANHPSASKRSRHCAVASLGTLK